MDKNNCTACKNAKSIFDKNEKSLYIYRRCVTLDITNLVTSRLAKSISKSDMPFIEKISEFKVAYDEIFGEDNPVSRRRLEVEYFILDGLIIVEQMNLSNMMKIILESENNCSEKDIFDRYISDVPPNYSLDYSDDDDIFSNILNIIKIEAFDNRLKKMYASKNIITDMLESMYGVSII
nr:MAG TPA: hypothetical protein [Caudoviricetes sp.]